MAFTSRVVCIYLLLICSFMLSVHITYIAMQHFQALLRQMLHSAVAGTGG